MTDQRISQLPVAGTLSGGEVVAGLQSGANVQIPMTNISQYVSQQVLTSLPSSTYVQTTISTPSCGIIIPYYFYTNSPYTDPTFDGMISLIRTYHSVPTIVILNQPGQSGTGGPGPYDGNYAADIKLLRAAGAIVLGYVDTGLGTRAASAVQSDILLWTSLYPSPAPDGIFLDNAPYDPGQGNANVLLYQSYYNFCHTNGYSMVVVNPGSDQQQAWYNTKVADIMMTWENSSWPPVSTMAGNFVGGHGDYDWKQNGLLVYGQASLNTGTLFSLLPYVRWVYCNSATLPNPWASLPSYLPALFQAVSQYNTGNAGILTETAATYTAGASPGTALTTAVNIVTATSGGSNVQLATAGEPGQKQVIINSSGGSITVNPPTGGTVGGAATVSMGNNTQRVFYAASSTAWY